MDETQAEDLAITLQKHLNWFVTAMCWGSAAYAVWFFSQQEMEMWTAFPIAVFLFCMLVFPAFFPPAE